MHKVLGIVLGLALTVSAPPGWSAQNDPTLVTIESGTVRGTVEGDVIAFKGIPFAQPPVGALRWRAPQPVTPWAGMLDASTYGPSCMQTDDLPKSEDCLTLNVWRPSAATGSPLPAMVWIYGGALAHGNTPQYPLAALAAQGVVAVSMNYRMGRLGFFAHPALAEEAPGEPRGNYGYLDQLAALQWVQRNIAAFSGNPGQVTIFGESAGGGSVMAHMVSPLSRGLFHRAILQSPGVPIARAKVIPLTTLADAERRAVAFARAVGVNRDGADALAALRALPAEQLVVGASALQVLDGMSSGYPVVGVSGAILDGQFLPETPEAGFAAGRQAMIPVIVGANSADLGIGLAATKDDLFALFGDRAVQLMGSTYSAFVARERFRYDSFLRAVLGQSLGTYLETTFMYPLVRNTFPHDVPPPYDVFCLADSLLDVLRVTGVQPLVILAGRFRETRRPWVQAATAAGGTVVEGDGPDFAFHSSERDVVRIMNAALQAGVRPLLFHNFPERVERVLLDHGLRRDQFDCLGDDPVPLAVSAGATLPEPTGRVPPHGAAAGG